MFHISTNGLFLTLFKYRVSVIFVVESGGVFDIVRKAVNFNQRNRGEDKKPSNAKKGLLKKKPFIELLPKDKSAQTSGSVFAEGIEKVKKTKYVLELKKIVDCFRDG